MGTILYALPTRIRCLYARLVPFYFLDDSLPTAHELQERLDADRAENLRRPTLLTVHFSLESKGQTTQLSRSTALRSCEVRCTWVGGIIQLCIW